MMRVAWVCAATAMGALIVMACGDTVVDGSGGAGAAPGGGAADGGGTTSSSMGGNGTGGGGPLTPSECLGDHHFPIAPDYDQFEPVMASHCKGTNHQDITSIEKLVFVGDSITQGTPPTPAAQFYRTVLGDRLAAKFPGIEVVECAENGARMDDLQGQLDQCFPGPEPKRSLVIMTMGGNDLSNWATNMLPEDEAIADAEVVANELRNAIGTLKDPAMFPAGAFFIFSNVYEYTDGTAELDSCPTASLIGLSGTYTQGANALAHLEELMMEIAVDTQTDMILMGEEFCGHGYRRDLQNTCYVGPDAENWFDISCIHPTPAGHEVIADLFELVVDE